MESLPYFGILGNIPKYFEQIKQAKAPEDRFSLDFVKNTLGFSSSNDQRLIGVLKAMNFLDSSGNPLKLYHDFRAEPGSPYESIGMGLKNAYHSIYARDENLHRRTNDEIKGHVMAVTGEKEGATTVRLITQSFKALAEIAKFGTEKKSPLTETEKQHPPIPTDPTSTGLNLTHTIVLNLPTTTTKEVYDAIFKSLKENLG